MTATIVAVIASFAMIVALSIACGPPSSFAGLVDILPSDAGGDEDALLDVVSEETSPPSLAPDNSLKAPRPIGPLAGSWINSTVPHFKWAITGDLLPATIGARLELSQTLTFDPSSTIAIDAPGSDITLTRDKALKPGVWFWRLRSITSQTFGAAITSPVWALLVRGDSLSHPPDAGVVPAVPSGTIFDNNGDGRPDFIAIVEFPPFGGFPDPDYEITPYLAADGDGGITTYVPGLADDDAGVSFVASIPIEENGSPLAIMDVNGDGFIDVAFEDKAGADPRSLYFAPGSAKGLNFTFDPNDVLTTVPLDNVANLAGAGDLDGDGFGDLAATTEKTTFATFGTASGFGATMPMLQLGSFPPPDGGVALTSSIATVAGFDVNGDGFTDVAFGDPFSLSTVIIFTGAPTRGLGFIATTVVTAPPPAGASLIVSGDFDGDGLSDLGFASLVGGKIAVCMQVATELIDMKNATVACYIPDTPPAGYATTLAMADVDLDGRDDILVGATGGGVDVIHFAAATPLPHEHIACEPYGSQITALSPGRPAKATWAALPADGSSIGIFEGNVATVKTTVKLPEGGVRFSQRLR